MTSRDRALLLLVAAIAALAGCKREVDTDKLEAKIKQSLAGKANVLSVECPEKVAAGTHCTARAEGGVVYKVSLTPTDDGVNFLVTSFTIERSKAAEMILEAVKAKTNATSIDCGQGTVELPGTLDCTIGDAGGGSQKLRAVFDKDGNLTFEPIPAGGAAPPTPAP